MRQYSGESDYGSRPKPEAPIGARSVKVSDTTMLASTTAARPTPPKIYLREGQITIHSQRRIAERVLDLEACQG